MAPEPILPADELLAHQGWVRALALSLVREPADADDIVQDTWLAALEHPPAREKLGPWLAHVLRNLVRKRQRGDARRRRREESARAPDDLPTPAELVERVGLQQDVVRAVVSLEEPYRSTLLLFYLEERAVSEIAQRQAIAEATVRQRLVRGREQLRERLDRSHGGREAWSLALLAWAARPSAPPTRVPRTRTSDETGAPLARVPAKSWIAGLGVVAVAALVFVGARSSVWNVGEPTRPPLAGPRSAEPHAVLVAPDPSGASSSSGRTAGGSAPQKAAWTGDLRVHVRRAADGSPVVGEWILVEPAAAAHPFAAEIRAVTGPDGDALLEGLPAGETGIGLQRRGDEMDWIRVGGGGTTSIELELPAGFAVAGEVVDADGAPIAGASIWVGEPWSRTRGHVLALTDAQGRFRVTDLQPDGMHWIGAFAPARAPSPASYLDARPGEEVAQRIVLDSAGGSLRGRVVDSKGRPVAAAQVLIGYEDDEWAASAGAPPRHLIAGADGTFSAEGLACGLVPVLVRAPGFAPAEQVVEIGAASQSSVALALSPEATVAGVVRSRSGKPIEGAEVELAGSSPFVSPRVHSGRKGRFELAGVAAGPQRLRARAPAGVDERVIDVRAGGRATWNPELHPVATIAGRVLDGSGRPVSGRELACREEGPFGRDVRYAITDADGRFSFGEARDVGHELVVEAPPLASPKTGAWSGHALPILRLLGVRPQLESLELRLEDPAAQAGTLSGRLVSAEGGVLVAAQLEILHVERGLAAVLLADAAGAFELELPAGTLEIAATAEGEPRLDLGRRVLKAGERLELGTVLFPRAALVHGAITGVAGGDLDLVWLDAEQTVLGRAGIEHGAFRSPPLPPGPCTLEIQGRGVQSAWIDLVLDEGADVKRDVVLQPAVVRRIELVPIGAEPRPRQCLAEARDGAGALRWRARVSFPPAGPMILELSAAPGAYRVEVTVDTGLVAEGELALAAGEKPQTTRLELREP